MAADAAARGMNGMSAEEAARLLDAVAHRRARRSFDGRPVPPEVLATLAERAAWRPFSDARCVVIPEAPPGLFLGVVGAYGGVSGARSALAFIGSKRDGSETVGYTGEAAVLAATSLGLSTCWVAGVFRPGAVGKLVEVEPNERVLAASPLGYATPEATRKERLLFSAGRDKMRRPLDQIAPGYEAWPEWAQAAVAAVRVAPSSMNRQPWRFSFEGRSLSVAFHGPEMPRSPKRLDCGIAMLHAELGAFGVGVTGAWERLDSPWVASFTPELG